MAPPTGVELLRFARQHLEAGRLDLAQALGGKVLAGDPRCREALVLLGAIAQRAGRPESAAEYLAQATARGPDNPELLATLGGLYRQLRRPDDAASVYRRWVQAQPGSAEAWRGLAEVLEDRRDFAGAVEAYRRVLVERPNDAQIHFQLGRALHRHGQVDAAMESCRRALELDPALAPAHAQLGAGQRQLGRSGDALTSFRQSLTLHPAAQTLVDLGHTLHALGRDEQAIDAYRQAMAMQPGDSALTAQMDPALRAAAGLDLAISQYHQRLTSEPGNVRLHFALGMALQRRRRFEQAIGAYRRTLQLSPDHPGALNNLAALLKDRGEIDEALAYFARAVRVRPDVPLIHSNLVYALHFHPVGDAAAIHAEHQRWWRCHGQHHAPAIARHSNDPSPDRRLRIGYVSPDFVSHPIGRFVSAFLGCHDPRQFEIICYACMTRSDAITARIHRAAHQWVEAGGMSHPALAQRIRADRIDILIDLSMHMANNRLMVFARKPAPVQATYLAYCSTTGLQTIDYRLTDPYLDPPAPAGSDTAPADRFYSEQSIYLRRSYWCYHPGIDTPPVNDLCALGRGYVTFINLNNFAKNSPAALRLWVMLLARLPGSRLILHSGEGSHRAGVRELFAAGGVAGDRIDFLDSLPLPAYFAQYQQADIALDPFPYPGGTTTCDALWMGVPVVSLVGAPAFTRSGKSILTNAGLPWLATDTRDQYLATVLALANDLPRLARLRAALRPQVQASVLMDAPGFTRDLEGAYRAMWQRWCAEMKADIKP